MEKSPAHGAKSQDLLNMLLGSSTLRAQICSINGAVLMVTILPVKAVSLGTVHGFPVNFINIWFRLAYPDRDSFRAIGALDRTGDGRLHFFEFLGAMIAAGRIQPLSTKSCLKL